MKVDVTFSETDEGFTPAFGDIISIPGGDYEGFGQGYAQGFEDGVSAASKWLPSDFKRLDYIETTGTQYIDTGFKPNQDTRVVCEFMFKGTSSNGSRDIYGTRRSITADMYWLRVVSSCWQPAYDTVLGSTGIAMDTTDWHIADQNKNIFYIDGVVGKEFDYGEFETPLSLVIGGGQAPYNGYTFYSGKSRYRTCIIYDNGVLVRYFIPCMNASGEVGMYDIVAGKFYGNAGTGEFVAGAEI